MKTKLFLIILLCSTSVFAKQIDVTTAKKVAVNFYYSRINQFSKTCFGDIQIQKTHTESTDGSVLFYAFDISDNGFIVVSAFDNVVPVLCYSFESKYPAENPPDNFMYWINNYKKQIVYAHEKNLLPDDKIIKEWKDLISGNINISKDRAVSPLLVSKWNQGIYYNHLCPPDASGPNGHTYAGCVATAMGQIMYYHRWPLTGTGTYSFTDPTYGFISADFGNSNYDWDVMQNQLSNYNDTIAKLLFHIGVSCDMHYGPSGSGMTNHKAAYAYRTYFKFCPQTQYVFKDSTTMDWDSILTTNLDDKKPLYYAGWDPVNPASGHAFVCDGYQGTNYYHFNMGWSGSADGYYYLNNLNPSGYNFNAHQELIKDIYPDTVNYTYPLYCSGKKTYTASAGTIADESGIKNYHKNSDCSWLIKPTENVSKINLSFDKLQTQTTNDFIKVYDGEDTLATLLGTYSGNTLPSAVSSTGKSMFIRFKSDNDLITGDGFNLSYNVTYPVYCSGTQTLTAIEDTIEDGSGIYNYNNSSSCTWQIYPTNSPVAIILHFLEFDTEPTNDKLEIWNAGVTPNVLLQTFSGSTLPSDFICSTNKIKIKFTTNIATTKQGWKLYYTTEVGVKENSSNIKYVSVYPNPVKDFVNINLFTEKPEKVNIILKNILGQILFAKDVQANGKSETGIDVSQFSNGVYILEINSEQGTMKKKIIKR